MTRSGSSRALSRDARKGGPWGRRRNAPVGAHHLARARTYPSFCAPTDNTLRVQQRPNVQIELPFAGDTDRRRQTIRRKMCRPEMRSHPGPAHRTNDVNW